MEVYKNRLIAENADDDKTSNVSIALTDGNNQNTCIILWNFIYQKTKFQILLTSIFYEYTKSILNTVGQWLNI